jgi:hypothetical protein
MRRAVSFVHPVRICGLKPTTRGSAGRLTGRVMLGAATVGGEPANGGIELWKSWAVAACGPSVGFI